MTEIMESTERDSSQQQKIGIDLGFTEAERRELLKIARDAIAGKTRGERGLSRLVTSERLRKPGAAFVSLYKKGMLRGHMGVTVSQEPLDKTVEKMAQAAASCDPRFIPLRPEEIPYIEVEISVLTPLQRITHPDEIEVGRHGILVTKHQRSGILLPQVAVERGWDRIRFLKETCRKAGLSEDAWQDEDTEVHVFSADVFS